MESVHQELMNKTAVVVDDDVDLAEATREQLESVGVTVTGVAHNGPAALEMISRLNPSIVVLDIRMPGMDGIEVAAKINEDEPRPIMLLSAYSDMDYVRRAAKTGVFTYLVKPVSAESLVPAIILTINRFKEMISLKAAVDSMKEDTENTNIIERARAIVMRNEGLTERQAYETIQRRSIDENKPVVAIAETIISAEQGN